MADFVNPSFEQPASDGTPGEADSWTWNSFQAAVEYADFNAATRTHFGSRESFEGGWSGNENWKDEYEDADLARVVFSAGTPHSSNTESFEWYEIVDQLVGESFDLHGWKDTIENPPPAAPEVPIHMESFEEAWQNDPFSTPSWKSGAGPNGYLVRSLISFPVVISAYRNKLWMWHKGHVVVDQVLELSIASGSYTDAASLQSALRAAYNAAVSPDVCHAVFSVLEEGDDGRVTFGYPGSDTQSERVHFMVKDEVSFEDCRDVLGLLFGAQDPGVLFWIYSDVPYHADALSCLGYRVANYGAHQWVYDLDTVEVIFDALISEDSNAESFSLHGWYGPSATWKDQYSPSDLSASEFNGSDDFENFETNWDGEELIF